MHLINNTQVELKKDLLTKEPIIKFRQSPYMNEEVMILTEKSQFFRDNIVKENINEECVY